MGLYKGGSRINREDPPGAPGRQQRFEGIGYGDIYHRAQGNTGIESTGCCGSTGHTGCIGPRGITGSQGYSTGCCGSTGPTYYGYPATGSGGLDIGVTGPPPKDGNMSSKNSNRKTLVDKWIYGDKTSRKRDETQEVELELPPEAYEMQSHTVEEPLSTAPKPLSRPINRKMIPYDFGKKNG